MNWTLQRGRHNPIDGTKVWVVVSFGETSHLSGKGASELDGSGHVDETMIEIRPSVWT